MPTRYSYDANGNLTARNDMYSFLHGGISSDPSKNALPEDVQQYLLEFNQAKQQYDQQYQLQREAFDLNKQNLEFNQNLATRQQDFAENSWKNNITNSARQMATLGINPAASGGGISGPTMSGGSQVAGVNSGSVSGRSVQRFNNKSAKIQLLSTLLQHAKDKKSLDIAQQQADNDSIRAMNDSTRVGIENRNSNTENRLKEAQRVWQNIQNGSAQYSEDKLRSLGLSGELVKSIRFVDPTTAVALGIVSALTGQPESMGGFNIAVVQAYSRLGNQEKRAFDDFFADHPDAAFQPNMLTANRMASFDGYDGTYKALMGLYGI